MLTPAQVIEELERRGYEVTPRRLVNWRQKGLLPPLAKRGRGRGRGWMYGWDDPLVIEQAITIGELLAWHSRTDWLYLPLWCLGYQIPESQIRPRLLALVDDNLKDVVGDAATPEDVAWRISRLSAQLTEKQRKRSRRPALSAEAGEYWLSLLAGSTDYAPNQDALAAIAESLWHAVGGEQRLRGQDRAWRAEPHDLRSWKRWFAQYASLPQLRDAIVHASDEELKRAQGDWRPLARLERAFGQTTPIELWWEFHPFWIRLVAVFGPWLTMFDLSLRRHGHTLLLDNMREQADKIAAHIETDPDIRTAGNAIAKRGRGNYRPLCAPRRQCGVGERDTLDE